MCRLQPELTLAVVDRIGGDEVRYWKVLEVSNLRFETRIALSSQMRSCGDRILLNGISSNRAHEHSTTATPACSTISRSEGQTTCVPFGLRAGMVAMSVCD